MDPRLLGRAMEENPELGRQLRLAWELHQQDQQDGFTVGLSQHSVSVCLPACLSAFQPVSVLDCQTTEAGLRTTITRQTDAFTVRLPVCLFVCMFVRLSVCVFDSQTTEAGLGTAQRDKHDGFTLHPSQHRAVSLSERTLCLCVYLTVCLLV